MLYLVTASLGMPPQSLRLHIDTGSSDLWVNTPSSSLCSASARSCSAAGTYNANASATYRYVGSWFNISYVDGSSALGDYATDLLSIGGASVLDFQFGIGYFSSTNQGILGIGYPTNEMQVDRAGKMPYPNLPAALAATGLTQSNAFSLYLNNLSSSTGNVLFGGIDTAQFTGPLWTLPILAQQGGKFSQFYVTLTGLSLGSTGLGSNLALAVLLDSGSSLTYLPDDIVWHIFRLTGAMYDEEDGVAFVPCSLATSTSTLNFIFTSPSIRVPMSELVLDLFDSTSHQVKFSNGVDACLFGIAPSGGGTNVLGDTFIRSAYVVYDLSNNEISMAQSRFNVDSSKIVEITTAGVPFASPVTSPIPATWGIISGAENVAAWGGSASLLASAWARTVAAVVFVVVIAAHAAW